MRIFQFYFALIITLYADFALAQESNPAFDTKIEQANTAYNNKDFKLAGLYYDTAFAIQKGTLSERYDAVCTWSLAVDTAKAMKELLQMVTTDSFSSLHYLQTDMDLEPLRLHKDWSAACKQASENRFLKEPDLNRALVLMLDTVNFDDQYWRKYSTILEEKYGGHSEQVTDLWTKIAKNDAANLIRIRKLFNEQGWPNIKEIGDEGSSNIFFVIQHAPLKDQIELLPLVRQAHKNKRLQDRHYVMLEDRIANRQGKLQIYGTQMGVDKQNGNIYYLQPVTDPDNLDKRRAAVGLQPIADYFQLFGAEWNLDEYKKNLPRYLELLQEHAEKLTTQ